MGYQDRKYDDLGSGREGGAWSRIRSLFGRAVENVENPLGWSVKMFTFRGIAARVHLITIVYIVGQLLSSLPRDAVGVGIMFYFMAGLFGIVLLHEFGHCFACRRVGGEADRIVMLPFGGLAFTMPPRDWRADLVTTIGGPAVNVALVPVLLLGLVALGSARHAVFNPLDPVGVIVQIDGGGSAVLLQARLAVWCVYYVNWILLAFNVLLPFFPLDGGRIVQALLWRKLGYKRGTEIAVIVGFGGSILLGLVALWAEQVLLVLIAVFGFVACVMERQRLRADVELGGAGYGGSGLGGNTAPGWEGEEDWGAGGDAWKAADAESQPSRSERKRAERAAAEAEEFDGLLAKISDVGMDGLTKKERKRLEELGEKQRGRK